MKTENAEILEAVENICKDMETVYHDPNVNLSYYIPIWVRGLRTIIKTEEK